MTEKPLAITGVWQNVRSLTIIKLKILEIDRSSM
jgi:hypothetical protein